MESTSIPWMALLAFGGAFVAAVMLFGCLFVISRRLGVSWRRHFAGYHLDPADASRMGRMLLGRETPPTEANVGMLLWIVRICWIAMTILIISYVLLMAGVA